MSLRDKLAANRPASIALEEIPKVIEFALEGTGSQSRGGKDIFAAKLDEAGTVRVVAYVPQGWKQATLKCTDSKMRAITGTRDSSDGMYEAKRDPNHIVTTYDFFPRGYVPKSRDQREWLPEDQAKACSVIFHAPADAEVDELVVTF